MLYFILLFGWLVLDIKLKREFLETVSQIKIFHSEFHSGHFLVIACQQQGKKQFFTSCKHMRDRYFEAFESIYATNNWVARWTVCAYKH